MTNLTALRRFLLEATEATLKRLWRGITNSERNNTKQYYRISYA